MKIRTYPPKSVLGGVALAALLQAACGGNKPFEQAPVADKIAPALTAAATAVAAGKPLDAHLARSDAAGRIQVYVYVSRLASDALESLTARGLRDAVADPSLGVVQGWISPQDLNALAGLTFVTRITLPQYAVPR
jgi:hypothetical protein